ncbi:hypothetical protein JOF29_001622 [Kribbella aluminosa]|uniref:Heparinase II/III-like protein n=1 Tax=Kribbella aluminosa TaxID=416017 RepID=A0ABS4UFX7_9ACTN|nr:hypothetical protein [Kribbella aluminosa]MBP2350539.1 hypothetical protein [Kribbella aluminosa]
MTERPAASGFDAELIKLAREAGDRAYDPAAGLYAEAARYNPIHTRIWTGVRHNHRESVVYALALLESGDDGDQELAEDILNRVLAVQDTDDASATYGIWSYFHEETLAEMVPPDWNWADFIGRELAFVLLRHERRLTATTRSAVRTALGHAARSIIRRNVAMSYTNIAAKGTFVTLAAGQLLDDPALTGYGVARVGRLRDQIQSAGSFAEYNSAGYWTITMEAIAAIVSYIHHPEAVAGARWIVDRLWEHLTTRWHSRIGQLSGPMARVYTDEPARGADLLALLAKATGFTGIFAELPPATPVLGLLGVALVDVVAPEPIVARLLETPVGEFRERFSYAGDQVPVVGTTWHGRNATVGSASVGEFWLQRRPLIGYWREPDDPAWGPARFTKLRVVKDDHDFSSAVFSSVQSGGQVLWSVGFVSPGGDEHIGLHQIEAGQPFSVDSLKLIVEFNGVAGAKVRVGGRPVTTSAPLAIGEQLTISNAAVEMITSIDSVVFGGFEPALSVTATGDRVAVEVDLVPGGEQQLILLDVGTAELTGTFSMFETPSGRQVAAPSVTVENDRVQATFTTLDGHRLALGAPTQVVAQADRLAAVHATIDDRPVPSGGLVTDEE